MFRRVNNFSTVIRNRVDKNNIEIYSETKQQIYLYKKK